MGERSPLGEQQPAHGSEPGHGSEAGHGVEAGHGAEQDRSFTPKLELDTALPSDITPLDQDANQQGHETPLPEAHPTSLSEKREDAFIQSTVQPQEEDTQVGGSQEGNSQEVGNQAAGSTPEVGTEAVGSIPEEGTPADELVESQGEESPHFSTLTAAEGHTEASTGHGTPTEPLSTSRITEEPQITEEPRTTEDTRGTEESRIAAAHITDTAESRYEDGRKRGLEDAATPSMKRGPACTPPTVMETPTPAGGQSYTSSGVGPRSVEENRTTLWIGDLERWEDEEYIYNYFEQYFPQSVTSVKIARDRDQQRSLGYGFIDFVNREVAERVLASAAAFKRSHGRRFKLTWARGKTRQPFNPAAAHNRGMMGVAPGMAPGSPAPLAVTPPPFVPGAGPGRWCIDIPKLPNFCTQPRIVEAVLRPLSLDTCTSIEPYDNESLRLVFATSNAFFAFIGRYRDGRFDIGGQSVAYLVPPDVMERWTRMYEQSRTQPPTNTAAPLYGGSAAGITSQWHRM
ncbi:RNA recognition motif protein [Gregarina niphandrodes]|uniref:RNA recognition motif protein n=1 Tax=Gregarina niphandrodes TaxID=110365 RepID=A0A023AZC9_GRENI|nr:RNA recognition motif protein [Gregarina niphandrodes]EZG44087.1 RNA recognition motif protein [Gregarina niphandrodes]|eukprot:XP_011132814.1 RNA recognition motif protein [Gregarina niphandrodes]